MDFNFKLPNKRKPGPTIKSEFYRNSSYSENTLPEHSSSSPSYTSQNPSKCTGLACKILLEDLGKRKPLSLVHPNKASENAIINPSKPILSSFYQRLSSLEELIEASEADLKNLQIPEGFFSPVKCEEY